MTPPVFPRCKSVPSLAALVPVLPRESLVRPETKGRGAWKTYLATDDVTRAAWGGKGPPGSPFLSWKSTDSAKWNTLL